MLLIKVIRWNIELLTGKNKAFTRTQSPENPAHRVSEQLEGLTKQEHIQDGFELLFSVILQNGINKVPTDRFNSVHSQLIHPPDVLRGTWGNHIHPNGT